jgi:hypothetical protein
MKKLIFVSTGRCGTKRIAQILRKYLPEEYAVVHQMPFSRLANVVGNLLFYLGPSDKFKRLLYKFIITSYCREKYFICSDPLTAMLIPKDFIDSADVCLVHIERSPEAFADSFFKLSRRRINSFIAHNFIPYWQIGIWPLENCISGRIKEKYVRVAKLKNKLFTEMYSASPNYVRIEMTEIFNSDFLSNLIFKFFNYEVIIPSNELKIKAN